MATLEQIRKPIEEDLNQFDSFLSEQFACENEVIAPLLSSAISSRGKGVRPLVLFLAAALCSKRGIVTRRAWVAALYVEMIHLASLIHDDVIDEASTRRGKPSINALWQSKRAVLTGDYILGRSLTIALKSGQYDIVNHVSNAIATLCEGEFLQDDSARRSEMTRERYLEIITKKTASLIAISASAGALSAGASPLEMERMRLFGNYIGMAFQIQDDILDFSPDADSGKGVNNDLREGKITLPLLIVLELSTPDRREHILELLQHTHESDDAIDELQGLVISGGGVDRAREVMQSYIERATRILALFPDSEYRTALMNLTIFITERNR